MQDSVASQHLAAAALHAPPMATQPSFIDVGYTEFDENSPEDNTLDEYVAGRGSYSVQGAHALLSTGDHATELTHTGDHVAEETDNDVPSGAGDEAIGEIDLYNDNDEPVNEILLSVLAKNRAGTWFSSQRSRHPLWSFFCPTDPSLGWEERGKSSSVDCLICYTQRYVCLRVKILLFCYAQFVF